MADAGAIERKDDDGWYHAGDGGQLQQGWVQLSEQKRSVVSALGWTKQIWDANDLPPRWAASWYELTAAERAAAEALGYGPPLALLRPAARASSSQHRPATLKYHAVLPCRCRR